MKTLVLRGSKQEIAEKLRKISGEVREAVVFLEEPHAAAREPRTVDEKDIFAEMSAFMVEVPSVDDSREAIYTRMEGE
jgi:hypothetical protein